jgi:hypothetical protein
MSRWIRKDSEAQCPQREWFCRSASSIPKNGDVTKLLTELLLLPFPERVGIRGDGQEIPELAYARLHTATTTVGVWKPLTSEQGWLDTCLVEDVQRLSLVEHWFPQQWRLDVPRFPIASGPLVPVFFGPIETQVDDCVLRVTVLVHPATHGFTFEDPRAGVDPSVPEESHLTEDIPDSTTTVVELDQIGTEPSSGLIEETVVVRVFAIDVGE